MPAGAAPTRRGFLSLAGTTGAGALAGLAMPRLSRAADRPLVTHGVQSGDVAADGGIVWARSDRPARMRVEVATTDSFRDIRATAIVNALPDTDFAAKALLRGLPSGQDVVYRIRFADLASGTEGPAAVGRFRTAPAGRRSVAFAWSGDVAGQGWGIDPARGGMRTFATMRAHHPDFFIHSGDSIYADCPIPAQQALPDGGTWRNLVTEEKAQPAATLSEFRGNYKYNLLDDNLRAFNAEVPVFAQWDDHEVTNDWWPAERFAAGRYNDRRADALAARACRAFHEYMPIRPMPGDAARIYRRIGYGPLLDIFMLDMRSYRGPNGVNAQTRYTAASHLLGPAQLAWLKSELATSRATWKVIAADMPLGLVSADGPAQGDGPPCGRELEIADLLSFMQRAGIRDTVWITADVHYTAAHRYDPAGAVFRDFEPFWEFVSGPLHAGTWGPARLDSTFGPRVVFQHGCDAAQGDNLAPCFGLQFFGQVAIDGESEAMTVTLKDVADRALWSVTIPPAASPARLAGRSRVTAAR